MLLTFPMFQAMVLSINVPCEFPMFTAFPTFPVFSVFPMFPVFPSVPYVPGVPCGPSVLGVPNVPGVSQFPGVPGVSCVPAAWLLGTQGTLDPHVPGVPSGGSRNFARGFQYVFNPEYGYGAKLGDHALFCNHAPLCGWSQ